MLVGIRNLFSQIRFQIMRADVPVHTSLFDDLDGQPVRLERRPIRHFEHPVHAASAQ